VFGPRQAEEQAKAISVNLTKGKKSIFSNRNASRFQTKTKSNKTSVYGSPQKSTQALESKQIDIEARLRHVKRRKTIPGQTASVKAGTQIAERGEVVGAEVRDVKDIVNLTLICNLKNAMTTSKKLKPKAKKKTSLLKKQSISTTPDCAITSVPATCTSGVPANEKIHANRERLLSISIQKAKAVE